MSLEHDVVRSIIVYKYKYDLEDTSVSDSEKTDFEKVGFLNNIFTATSTVVNFSDAQVEILCELNDNNYRVGQPTYVLYTKYSECGKEQYFTIKTVDIKTSENTIKIIAEPIANELRNGVSKITGKWSFDSPNNIKFTNMLMRLRDNSAYRTVTLTSWTPWTFTPAGRNGLEVLGGSEFSILDLYGGQFSKEGFRVVHQKELGNPNRNYRLSLGVNVTGMNVTIDTSEVVNACLHYYSYNDPAIPTNPNKIIYLEPYLGVKPSKIGKKELRNGKVIKRDWSQYADVIGQPPPETDESTIRANMLRESAKWNTANSHLNEPKLSIELDFFSLRGKIGYEMFDSLLTLNLGDSILYYHEPLDWEITARVNGYVYNIITDTYDKLSIGNGKKTILDRIKEGNK